MKIVLHLFGTLNRFAQPDTPGIRAMDIPDGSNVIDLLKILKTKDNEVAAAAVNGKTCPFDKELQDSDEVYLLTALGGG